MKPSFLLLIILISLISSCSDEDPVKKSKADLLAGKPWIYDEYFRSYDTNTERYYGRGREGNILDLDPVTIQYKFDGTYIEQDPMGNTITGTWRLIAGETQVQVTTITGTFTSTIILLEEDHYQWYSPVGNGSFGIMMH